jgi:chemotaxis protein MotB
MKNSYYQDIDTEEDDANRWILPYADFITLLFAVFVVMYAVSNVEESKFKSLADSLSVAMNVTKAEVIEERHKNEKILAERENSEGLDEISANLQNDLAPLIAENKVRIISTKGGISIEINEKFLFKSGQAELTQGFNQHLDDIADILKKHHNQIEVEGHTDNAPIHSAFFPSNWELSAARASTVVRALASKGVPEEQLSAVGFAATHPIDTNFTEDGRLHNRRVDIRILGKTKTPL